MLLLIVAPDMDSELVVPGQTLATYWTLERPRVVMYLLVFYQPVRAFEHLVTAFVLT